MFRSTLTIIRPILRIVFLQMLATYWDPAMFTNYASVHACYKYINMGGGTVGGIRSMRGCCVSSGWSRAASLLVYFLLTCSLDDYGRSASIGVSFYVGPIGGLWVLFLIIPLANK